MEELPDVRFYKTVHPEIELETITFEKLFSNRADYDHLLDHPHRLHFYCILLVTKGKGIHHIDFKPYEYDKGSIIFVSKDQVHAFDPKFNSEGLIIVFNVKFLTKNVIHSDVLFLHRLYNYHLHTPILQYKEHKNEDLISIFENMHTEYHLEKIFAKQEILRSQLKILLLKSERIKRSSISTPSNLDWIELFTRFKTLVDNNQAKTRNAKDYAAHLKISHKHLNKVCKDATGKTSKQFIDSNIILEVKRRLSSSSMSVKELTYKFGFDEPTNFLKFFKKHTGQTPNQFRAELSN